MRPVRRRSTLQTVRFHAAAKFRRCRSNRLPRQNSPGLQPWVSPIQTGARKVAPDGVIGRSTVSNPPRRMLFGLGPVLPHSITPRYRIRGQPVRRSQCSMLPTVRSRPRKRGALHNRDVGEVGRTTTKRLQRGISRHNVFTDSLYLQDSVFG